MGAILFHKIYKSIRIEQKSFTYLKIDIPENNSMMKDRRFQES